MRVKCYSVRLKSLTAISDKCYKAIGFDGSEALIPKSQYFGEDYDVLKANAHWISAWILDKKKLQYSAKKENFFDNKTGRMLPKILIEKHVPKKKEISKVEPHNDLKR